MRFIFLENQESAIFILKLVTQGHTKTSVDGSFNFRMKITSSGTHSGNSSRSERLEGDIILDLFIRLIFDVTGRDPP